MESGMNVALSRLETERNESALVTEFSTRAASADKPTVGRSNGNNRTVLDGAFDSRTGVCRGVIEMKNVTRGASAVFERRVKTG